jgi:hypothetical protein
MALRLSLSSAERRRLSGACGNEAEEVVVTLPNPDAGGRKAANSGQSQAAKADAKGEEAPAIDAAAAKPLDEHRIRERAYEIWVEEGKPEGRHIDHWQRARWELEQTGS